MKHVRWRLFLLHFSVNGRRTCCCGHDRFFRSCPSTYCSPFAGSRSSDPSPLMHGCRSINFNFFRCLFAFLRMARCLHRQPFCNHWRIFLFISFISAAKKSGIYCMTFNIHNLTYCIDSRPLIQEISLSFQSGILYGILGPNGSGKSTLLKTMFRNLEANKRSYDLARSGRFAIFTHCDEPNSFFSSAKSSSLLRF